jgi:fibronectin type 3 domain-containing protein
MSVGLRAKEGLLLILTGLSLIQLAGCSGAASLGTATPAPSGSGLTLPQMPTNLAATAGDAQVTLTWSTSSGATSYHVKRATTNSGPYLQVATPSSAGFLDSSLTNGSTYFYVVSAVSAAGESGNSPQVSAKPVAATQPQVPSSPGGLTALPGNAEVTLTWSTVLNATSYNVKRSTTSSGPYAQIATASTTGYADATLTNGKTYFYVVSASNSAGESANSTPVSAKPTAATQTQVPAAPQGLAATAGDARVTLTWSTVLEATSYHLKRATTSGGPYNQLAAPLSTGYTDTAVANGTTYYYVVSALGSAGEGPNSSQSSAKPTTQVSPRPPTVTSVTITPTSASLTTSGTLQFAATVQGTSNTAVTWKASLGSVSSSGMYTAPSTAGTATLTAASNADSTKSASATITITAPPPPGSSALPSTFFDLSVSAIQASHFPSVAFGGVRLWDTNTSWAQIETSSGTYDWTLLDEWITEASSHGKDVMYTFGRVPHWASMRPSEACPYNPSLEGCAAPPSDIDSGDNAWKAYVTAVVEHSLSSPELHIAYYEMWNEPDLKRNWTGTPAQLVKLATDAYSIIHQLDPNAKLIGPTPSTANQWGVHFLPAYFAAGGATPLDIVGCHAYLYTDGNFSTSPAGITTSISQLQALMSKYNISGKPIWFTEGNWNPDVTNSLTEAQKAAYLAQEYMIMWSSGAVSRYYWYSWDSPVGTLWTPSDGLNPAGTAYNLLTHWLVGSTHSTNPCSEASDGTWTCALTLSTGYPAEIIWNPSASKTMAVDASFATYETLSNSTVHSIANHEAAIGALPVLIVGSQAVR